MSKFVVLQGDDQQVAGAVVWWSLSGQVERQKLVEANAEAWNTPFCEEELPPLPTPETVLLRAARSHVKSKREQVRPGFQRGTYVFLRELQNELDTKKLVVENLVHLSIEYIDEKPLFKVAPLEGIDGFVNDSRRKLAGDIEQDCGLMQDVLFVEDVSAWLLKLLTEVVGAVGLRERGGFYFVPRDRLDWWRQVTEIIKSVSQHRFFELPAMRTEEAVEAILTATRAELQDKLQEVETYLAGTVSTRGLNAYEKELEALNAKAARYAELLGVSLADITDRSESLKAMTTAARLMVGADKKTGEAA